MSIARARTVDAIALSPRRLLRREQAAIYVGVSPNTFDKLVRDGDLPGPKVFPNATVKVWDVRDLDAFADSLPYADAPIVPRDTTWDD